MYIVDIKYFSKKEKEAETLAQTIRIYSQDIEREFRIDQCAMLIMKTLRDTMEIFELANQKKHPNIWRKCRLRQTEIKKK